MPQFGQFFEVFQARPGNLRVFEIEGLQAGQTLEMETDDFYFGPTFVKGPAGANVTLSLHNEGKSTHTFSIDSANVNQQLAPDASATVQVTIPASGELTFYCKFHRDQGMQGAFFTG